MGKTRNTGFSNNAIQYNNGSIAFVSGSTTLLNISSSGAIVTTGTITANTLLVQTVTSSVSFVTGSTKFGALSSNTHTFTGSLAITGGLAVNAGNVGIGTSSPDRLLQVSNTAGQAVFSVVGATNDSTDIFLGDTDNKAEAVIRFINGANTFNILQGGSTRMTITASGSVGIGNTSPQGLFHIGGALASSGDAAAITLKQTGTNETTGIYLERNGERKGYAIYVGGSLDSLVFQRNNAGTKSDVMTLTRDGFVGIGVVPSSWSSGVTALQVGTAASLWNRTSDNLLVLASNSYYDGSIDRQITTNTSNRIYFVNGATYFDRASSTAAGSQTPWSTSMIITSGGYVYANTSTNPLPDNAQPQLGII
jgi:hypothetical protein